MFNNLPLFWRAALFTGSALLIILFLTWFFYLSPVKKRDSLQVRPSRRLTNSLVGMLALSSGLLIVGALWDASKHILTGQIPAGADFLWPPHLMIYGSFLLSFVVALVAIGGVALAGWKAGIRDPRRWVRSNPYLGAVALASVFTLLSIPGDALWHLLFGLDLTAWSPPHLILMLMSCTVLVSAVGLFSQSAAGEKQSLERSSFVYLLLALMLNVLYLIGVLEWELPGGRSTMVDARPIWSYPLVAGCVAFLALMLAKFLVQRRWSATWTAILFFAIRLGVSFGLGLTHNVVPIVPLPFILGAVVIDLVPWKAISSLWLQNLAISAVFTAGYALLTIPVLVTRKDLQVFTAVDFLIMMLLVLAVTFILLPLIRLASRRLSAAQVVPVGSTVIGVSPQEGLKPV